MDFEQLIKRVEWMDEQRRKDKDVIATLEIRLANLETSITAIPPQIQEAADSVIPLTSLPARLDGYEKAVPILRKELTAQIQEVEKRLADQSEKLWKNERQRVNRNLSELKKAVEPIAELERDIHSVSEEAPRLKRLFTQLEKKFEGVVTGSDEALRATRITEESRKQDTKRIMDLQGEVSAARKRIEELREKVELKNESIRQIENRLNEMLLSENERKQAQASFIEQQSKHQIQRDLTSRDWKDTYEKVNKQSEQLQNQLIEWDSIQRAVKRAQETYDDITQKSERRINEIAEMQRLAEDRFRQEWISFKADDQKRWTNYTLSHDETYREIRSDMEKMSEQLTTLDDATQNLADLLQQTTEATEKSLQDLMNWSHEFLSNFERVMGHTRAKK